MLKSFGTGTVLPMSTHTAPQTASSVTDPRAIFEAAAAGRLFRVTFSLGMSGWRSAVVSSQIVLADNRQAAIASVSGGRSAEGPLARQNRFGEWVL